MTMGVGRWRLVLGAGARGAAGALRVAGCALVRGARSCELEKKHEILGFVLK